MLGNIFKHCSCVIGFILMQSGLVVMQYFYVKYGRDDNLFHFCCKVLKFLHNGTNTEWKLSSLFYAMLRSV